MKQFLLLFYFFATFEYQTIAQSGFSKIFLLPGSLSNTIVSLTVDQDTIVCFGTFYSAQEERWGVYLAKFDSLGSFIQMSTDFDSTYQQSTDLVAKIIKTKDNGYLCVSTQGGGVNSAAYKFSHQGTLEWTNFYRQESMQVITAKSVVELLDGYLISGWYAVSNDVSTFLLKLTNSGGFAWFKTDAGLSGYDDFNARAVEINSNRFLLTSGISPVGGYLEGPGYWSKSRLVEIDSNGTLQWEWSSAQNENEFGMNTIAVQNDQEVVYSTMQYVLVGPNYEYELRLILRKINVETGATIWRKQLTPGTISLNSLWSETIASPSGDGIDAVGIYQAGNGNGFIMSGWSGHVNWDGDLVWERHDTAYYDPNITVNESKLYALSHLSSGSIIAGGYIKSKTPNSHIENWLLKLSPDGCLSPDDCAKMISSSTSPSGQVFDNWELYPNPAQGHTYLYPDPAAHGQKVLIKLSDATGKNIEMISQDFDPTGRIIVSLSGLSQGLYFYTVVLDGVELGSGKIIVE